MTDARRSLAEQKRKGVGGTDLKGKDRTGSNVMEILERLQ